MWRRSNRRSAMPSAVFILGLLIAGLSVADTLADPPRPQSTAYSVETGLFTDKFCTRGGDGNIATLAWKQRSDWINVRTDVEPAARGDGQADDTAAIQRALDRIGPEAGDPKVVYLPPGIYRITATLSLANRDGGMLIGHGAATVLRWDGAPGGRMYWSNGASRQSYIGITWDGNHRAAVGIDHDAKTQYETRVLHEQMEFRNFTVAGIRIGHEQKFASAEMMFSDLKFLGNKTGVLLQAWNDYNNVFDGCQFEDNDFGIRAEKGNIVVRNSRFENSKESDLYLSTHSHSIRRVVSSGSRAFITTVRGPISNSPVRVEETLVTGWTNPDGAIITELRGPLTVFDTTFSAPPNDRAPIRLNNPAYMNQLAIVSNVISPETKSIIDAGPNGRVYAIPASQQDGAALSPTQIFLRNTRFVPQDILDVKQDCGARGDGISDDTRKIQTCLNAARDRQESTVVYFPSGTYRTTDTVSVPAGAGFQIDGTGWHSRIVKSGKREAPTLHIHDPDGLEITHLALGADTGGVTLLQTGSRPAGAYYHNLFGYHDDEMKQVRMLFDDLPAGTAVLSGLLDGRLTIRNSSQAVILLGMLTSVQMIVEGNSAHSGFLGVLARVSALEDYPLIVRDSQDLVQTDWYNEQTPHLILLQGNGSGDGHIILDHTEAATTAPVMTRIEGFAGSLAHIGGMFGSSHDTAARSIVGGEGKVDLLMAGNMFWYQPPGIPARLSTHLLGNSIHRKSLGPLAVVEDAADEDTDRELATALAHFRRLGAQDLAMNYCQNPAAAPARTTAP